MTNENKNRAQQGTKEKRRTAKSTNKTQQETKQKRRATTTQATHNTI